jgi:hypothetical protein
MPIKRIHSPPVMPDILKSIYTAAGGGSMEWLLVTCPECMQSVTLDTSVMSKWRAKEYLKLHKWLHDYESGRAPLKVRQNGDAYDRVKESIREIEEHSRSLNMGVG